MLHSLSPHPKPNCCCMEPPLPMTFPMDLIAEILILLPVKSILRFKCVSTSWNALISEPHFVNKHRLTSAADPKRHHVMVAHPFYRFHYTPILKDFLLPSLLLSSSTSLISSDVPAACDAVSQAGEFFIIGSYHGMLCLHVSQSQTSGLVLWNPSVRSFRLIAPIPWPQQGVFQGWGFGYDHSNHTYKIVSVSVLRGYDTHVFMLGSDSAWRPIPKFPDNLRMILSDLDGKFASGTFNWMCFYDHDNLWRAIVSLDPVTERYRQLPIPDCLLPHCLKLHELKGCLCIFALHQIHSTIDYVNYDVWVMKEYGKKESWIKLFRIPSMEWGSYYPNPIWISEEDDEILMEQRSCLIVYNSKTGAFKDHFFPATFSAVAYVESLMLPNF